MQLLPAMQHSVATAFIPLQSLQQGNHRYQTSPAVCNFTALRNRCVVARFVPLPYTVHCKKHNATHKTGSTQRIAMTPVEDRATAVANKDTKFGSNHACGSRYILADRQTNRHTQTFSLQYFATAPAGELIIIHSRATSRTPGLPTWTNCLDRFFCAIRFFLYFLFLGRECTLIYRIVSYRTASRSVFT